jgi:hypothetical protein
MAIVEQTYDFLSNKGKTQLTGSLSAFSGLSTKEKEAIIADIPMATKLQFGIARFADSIEVQSMAEDLAISPFQLNEALKMHHAIVAVAAENIVLDGQRPVFVTLSILNGQLVFNRATNSINGAIMDNVSIGQVADVYIVARTFLTGFDEVMPNKRYMVDLTTNILTEFDALNNFNRYYVGQGIDQGLLRFEDDFCKPTIVTSTGTWALMDNTVLCDLNLINWQLNMTTILCDLPAEAGSWSLLTTKVFGDLPVVINWALLNDTVFSDFTLAPVVPVCTLITSASITGNSSASGTTGTYGSSYSPNNATPPSVYNWSVSGQGASVNGANNGLNCSFNFGTSGNATITLSVTSCNGQIVTTTKTVSQTPVVASAKKVIFIKNNTGAYRNDVNSTSGFNADGLQDIANWKAVGIDAFQLTYYWEEIETAPNIYNTTVMEKQMAFLVSQNLKYTICIWFYNRDGNSTSVTNALEKITFNDGSTSNRAFDYSSPNVRAHLNAGTAAIATAINNNQSFKDNFLNFILGIGHTEEFYNNYVTDGNGSAIVPGTPWSTANYSSFALTNWRQFLFSKYGATAPYSIGGVNVSGNMPFFHLDASSAPISHQNGLNSAAGKDWQYFIAKETKTLWQAFQTGAKGVNSTFQTWHYPSAWYDIQTYLVELMWFAHYDIASISDGIYTTANDHASGFYPNNRFADICHGTWPNKNIGFEFDPDDASFGGGGNNAQFGNVAIDFAGSKANMIEFIRRGGNSNKVIFVHFAMYYGNGSGGFPNGNINQISGWGPVISDINANFGSGQNRYDRSAAPNITGSLLNYVNTDYWRLGSDWVNVLGNQNGHPVNFLITP